MWVAVDVRTGEAASAAAELRLRLVLSRFATAVVAVALRMVACGPGRVRLRARVDLVRGAPISLTAEDDASEAAMVHFIDRLGRAVARRWNGAGGPRG